VTAANVEVAAEPAAVVADPTADKQGQDAQDDGDDEAEKRAGGSGGGAETDDAEEGNKRDTRKRRATTALPQHARHQDQQRGRRACK
jgi:hypothetical protein